eukprot:m.175574 g.175574  ORF g.175574 m.175574 type:complete len:53 (-) comp18361_c0_seq1:1275-1433(-)
MTCAVHTLPCVELVFSASATCCVTCDHHQQNWRLLGTCLAQFAVNGCATAEF